MAKETGRNKAKEIKVCRDCGRPTKKLFNKLCPKCLKKGAELMGVSIQTIRRHGTKLMEEGRCEFGLYTSIQNETIVEKIRSK